MSPPQLPPGFPLAWPEGWDRTSPSRRLRSKYNVTFGAAADGVACSLSKLGAGRLVVTSDVPLRIDGKPRADAREPADPGIAVWWVHRASGQVRTMACDAWETRRENLRAIGLALEGLRAIERSKSTSILDRAMQSFNVPALPAGRPWFCDVLELAHWPASDAEITAAYRVRVKVVHPDQGGNAEKFYELNRAELAARAQIGGAR